MIENIVNDMASHALFNAYADQIPDSFTAAYDIQDQVTALLLKRGIRSAACGYKLAVNSAALMTHFGITEPAAARMFSDQNWPSPARLVAKDYRSLLIEPEIMTRIDQDLPPVAGGYDRQSVLPAVGRYFPAIELVDSREASLSGARLPSIIAQNVTTEGLVVGGPGQSPADLNLSSLTVEVAFDGEVVASSVGTAPQHPLDAIAWLANHLNGRGGMIKAGDIVMCGTHQPPKAIGAARHVKVAMGPLGVVEFEIA